MDKAAQHVTTGIASGWAGRLVAVALPPGFGPAEASHEPADRTAASGSTLAIMEAASSDDSFSEEHTILSTELKTSNPTDLVLQLTAECALWTDVTTVGNDESEAVATVNAWIEVDGEPVPVSSEANAGDPGVVTLCHRDYRVETMHFDDENATIERYLETKHANAFNWVSLDVGSGVHNVTVKAQLEGHAEAEDGEARAKALVGKRTLVIDPVKMPNDAEI
jgi:hypothetical protein